MSALAEEVAGAAAEAMFNLKAYSAGIADTYQREMAGKLFCAADPLTDDEIEAAAEPWPHAFQDKDCGLFPVGEVSVIAAPGREGKTFATIGLAVSYVLGQRVGGLSPQEDRSVYVWSAEDDRRQYAKKIRTRAMRVGAADRERIIDRVRVFDLDRDDLAHLRTLIAVVDREPVPTGAHRLLIDALRPLGEDREDRPGLIVFETASTLSDADEDNRAFRVLIRALKEVARELECAVVLVHHTSQASMSNLATLDLSVSDIRGGTALVANSRQNALLVNLGSDSDPYPDADARTVLRRLAFPDYQGRVSVLVTLDSSKSMDPAPVFFCWEFSANGPACVVTPPAREIQGLTWRALHRRIRGARAEQRHNAREEARGEKSTAVVDAVRAIESEGGQPTARAVSDKLGRSPTWAKPHLERAAEAGDLIRQIEHVPRSGGRTVYRSPSPF